MHHFPGFNRDFPAASEPKLFILYLLMVLDSHQERVDQNGEQNDLREDVTDHELVEPVTKVKDNNEGARPRDPLETAEAKEFE